MSTLKSKAMPLSAAERRWLRVHDALVRFVAVDGNLPLLQVASVLERSGVSQVPVLEGEQIIGWIGDRELRRARFPE